MGVLGNLMTATVAGISAFRETMLSADPGSGRAAFSGHSDEWSRWEARKIRYSLNWGLFSNDAYRDLVHLWAARFKTTYGTSKHIRHIYNPAGQMGDFWSGHLWGGTLDQVAGDGETEPSALPVLTDHQEIRPAIARLRRDSRWQVNKDVVTLWGSVLGDVAIRVVDDPSRGQVRKELVHPGHLADVTFDAQRNVRGYRIEKWEADPRPGKSQGSAVPYREVCFRDGDRVVYQTFLDGKPFAWNGVSSEWEELYGFVPLVVIPHRSIGLNWGANSFYGSTSRFIEVDEQASVLGDSNRKQLNGPWLFSGVKGPSEIRRAGADRSKRSTEENEANPEPSRTEVGFLYASDPNAKATPLTLPSDVKGICQHIDGLLAGIEKKHPELLADTGLGGTVTAEAVRNARQLASSRVQAIRPGYDDGEVCTNQMALAIGGFRGYPGYEGFGLESYREGRLDHQIGHRPVFEVDPIDAIAEDAAFWGAANTAVGAGCPIELYLERNGWSAGDLAKFTAAKAKEVATSPPVPDATNKPLGFRS